MEKYQKLKVSRDKITRDEANRAIARIMEGILDASAPVDVTRTSPTVIEINELCEKAYNAAVSAARKCADYRKANGLAPLIGDAADLLRRADQLEEEARNGGPVSQPIP